MSGQRQISTRNSRVAEIREQLATRKPAIAVDFDRVGEAHAVPVCELLAAHGYKVEYLPNKQVVKGTMTTPLHGAGAAFALTIADTLRQVGIRRVRDFVVEKNVAIETFRDGEFKNKGPDAAIIPAGCQAPTLVIEVGFSESEEKLGEDARLLLTSVFGGTIKVVVLIKFEYTSDAAKLPLGAYIEICKLRVDGRMDRYSRKTLFPEPPRDTGHDSISLSVHDLFPSGVPAGTPDMITVTLDDLREESRLAIDRMKAAQALKSEFHG